MCFMHVCVCDLISLSLCEDHPGCDRLEQRKERLTSRTQSGRFGMEWSIVDIIVGQEVMWWGVQ